ncbi:hypothetical protein HGRIS_012874 [Hohenbuehelia grisea]|uniref:Transmembrane protein n=1 Tax=Hohenbuehelia grisea TaxID=104357 RepID=A0ABR3ITS5_9AGAR
MQASLSLWLVVGMLCAVRVRAHSPPIMTNATCSPSFQWAFNSLNQSPCVIRAYLATLCSPNWSVYALQPGSRYIGPPSGEASPCSCNMATYMLLSACGACQNRTWVNWYTWSSHCPAAMTNYDTYPGDIPPETAVPAWAFINVLEHPEMNATFSPRVAEGVGNMPESKGPASQSSTSTSSSSMPTSLTSPTTTATSLGFSSTSVASASSSALTTQVNAAAIVGGILGGVLLVTIASLACFIFMQRMIRNRRQAFNTTVPTPFAAWLWPGMSRRSKDATESLGGLPVSMNPGPPPYSPFRPPQSTTYEGRHYTRVHDESS